MARPLGSKTEISHSFIAGIDEAGRGPLAGPVVAAAVVLKAFHFVERIDDSKRLTPLVRQRAYEEILKKASVGVGIVEAGIIDAINILRASMLAMEKAVAALEAKPRFLLIDGPMTLSLPSPQMSICKGDTRCISIMCASIVAKVIRDAIMVRYDAKYPLYGFARHKGYGTPEHLHALGRFGPSPIHRLTFEPLKSLLAHGRN